jgi:prevent-host-death family protein
MQKALSELASLPESELNRLVEHEPVLITQNGEPKFVAQSPDAFDSMVRRLRELEAASTQTKRRLGKLILFSRD